MEKLTYLSIGDIRYPMKFDWYVLKEVQKQYGTIAEFEKKIKGFVETGEVNEQGKKLYRKNEPCVECIMFVLPLMIKEGFEIELEENHKGYFELNEKLFFQEITANIFDVADQIIVEMERCINPKK